MSTEIEKAAESKALVNSALKNLKWPTSRPGPQVTPPPPGERPVATRTDQMVEIAYDQERGEPINNSTI
jgi:hypothetical protein